MRSGFKLDEVGQKAVAQQLRWYAARPDYLERAFGRAELYLYHIVGELEARGMPLELALLPVVESAYEPYAYSRARASGMWQFIPGTGSRFGLKQNWWYDGRRDVVESTRAALDYLQYLHDQFDGDWLVAIGAYNCGEMTMSRAIARNQARHKPTDFWSLKLPKETRAYVPKLLAMKRLVTDPETYGLTFSRIPNQPYFARVNTLGQIDLRVAAEIAGVTYDELYELNPAFHRWATDPQGPYFLLLPSDSAEAFRTNVVQLSDDERLKVSRYDVRRGDTMASVAAQFSTNPQVIRELNDIPSGPLVVGSELRVPADVVTLPPKVVRAAALVDGRGRHMLRSRLRVVVRRGDSLWSIARRNGVDVHALAMLNGMQPDDPLRTGQHLRLATATDGTSRAASSGSTHRRKRHAGASTH
jgi:membrane-bound lytic murein transglycosylase D